MSSGAFFWGELAAEGLSGGIVMFFVPFPPPSAHNVYEHSYMDMDIYPMCISRKVETIQ